MKRYFIILLFAGGLVCLACDKDDPCEVNHVIINGECVPDYIFPDNSVVLQNGDKYYHKKFGPIIYKDGQWTDKWNNIIEEL
ncbi:hypothetical protein KO504_03380 [Winogradskyella psychrotolerans]|uniref:hypothetical protein n=1 Tax=Winogradskyella psychrotolerans TaxID=1344585 RepID=UPI001C07CB9C|nr:hypothetical protein [Winogradskyella psychrotolerans]MBU2920369.1 hypothetical protein [Winogradskyella psychrotolerans]